MPDAHDSNVLHALIAAVRATPGAPETAAAELEVYLHSDRWSGPEPSSVLDAARDAIVGRRPTGAGDTRADGEVEPLEALMGRLEAAKADDRLSGPARDAVIRAFDPIKAARDLVLQRAGA